MLHAPIDPGVGNVVHWIILEPVDSTALFVKSIFEIASLLLKQRHGGTVNVKDQTHPGSI